MGLAPRKTVIDQDYNAISVNQLEVLGTTMPMVDGREWRYGFAGAVDLAPGKIAQASVAVAIANHQNLAVSPALAVGDKKIGVTLGATAAAADLYKDGFVHGYDASGVGQTLRIKGHPAINSAAAGVLRLADPAVLAMTTSGKVSLSRSPYAAAVITDHTVTTGLVIGVPQVTITAAWYGWFQVQGPASVLTNGTPAANSGVVMSATTDGAVDVEGASAVTQRLGQVLGVAGVTAKYNLIDLNIRV